MENKTYTIGTVFYARDKTFYMIVKGSILQHGYGDHEECVQEWVRPSRLRVQPMKFKLYKTELIPIDDLQNKDFYYRDDYDLVKDETKQSFLYREEIFFCWIYEQDKVKKQVKYGKDEDRSEGISKIVFLD
jgi:hypothetical protein